jgi:hypothetical protein
MLNEKIDEHSEEWVWAVPRSLATTKGISIDFFSLVTKMFQFAKYPLPDL